MKPLILLPFLAIPFLSVTLAYTDPLAPSTCTDAHPLDKSLNHVINAQLSALLSNSTFLSVFKVSLDNDCPFWQEDGQCVMRECTVCNCPDSDVPPAWRAEDRGCPPPQDRAPPTASALHGVDRSLAALGALTAPRPWHAADAHAWTAHGPEHGLMYVDLRKNPERFTGYAGDSSRRVWSAIYQENCFSFSEGCRSGVCAPGTCKEERVLYRLISGLHASISMHIAKTYLYGETWAHNVDIYRHRVRDPPGRTDNLNVAYAVVLRAVSKAARALHPKNYPYETGDDDNDAFTRERLEALFELPVLQPGCEDRLFDESDMFLRKTERLLPEFRNAFRNISMIMDCVGCEKCRLWGKLQFLGLGTALRILFEDEMPDLERNEVIALINLLYKLSTSVLWVEKMEAMVVRDARIKAKSGAILMVFAILLLAVLLRKKDGKRTLDGATTGKAAKGTDGAQTKQVEAPTMSTGTASAMKNGVVQAAESEVSTVSTATASTPTRSSEEKGETSEVIASPARRSERLRKRRASSA